MDEKLDKIADIAHGLFVGPVADHEEFPARDLLYQISDIALVPSPNMTTGRTVTSDLPLPAQPSDQTHSSAMSLLLP